MTTLKERAEEYAIRTYSARSRFLKSAEADYLAGARAMALEAYAIAFNGNGSDAADCAVNIANQIKALLPDDASEPERRG